MVLSLFNKPTALLRRVLTVGVLTGLAFAESVAAQSAAPATATPATAAPAVVAPGIQSMNIQDVKPEASADPNYLTQSNGERAQVQPGNNAPIWRQVGQGVPGYSSLPVTQAPEAGVLIQPFVQYPGSRLTNAGEAWRQVRNQWIIPYGGALIAVSALALAMLFFTRGSLGKDHPDTGKKIERFTPFERAAHWSNAIAFCALAISGFVMAFGKFLILPVIGTALFGWLTYVLKNVHNFMGPLFAVSLTVIILVFVKDNILSKVDFQWLAKAGGMFSDHHVPSERFNAGEKGLFWWGITIPGVFVVISGLVLDKLIPGLGLLRGEMQIAHMVHAVLAVWMIALLMGHIYMGTVGMRGAYSAMRTGYVTEAWAKEHHELWHDDVKAGKIPAQRSALPKSSSEIPVSAVSV
jgi:formate dehydrogenase subunit gamma